VLVEGWAIVDNTSGEDWKDVLVGVGSSSALSFKYDLWSVRQVHRETLASEEKFAVAPPSGISPYGGAGPNATAGETALAELGDDEIRRPQGHPEDKNAERVAMKDDDEPMPAPMSGSAAGSMDYESSVETTSDGGGGGGRGGSISGGGKRAKSRQIRPAKKVAAVSKPAQPTPPPNDARVSQGDSKMRNIKQQLSGNNNTIVIEGYGDANRPDANRRANDRANIVRNQLIDQGVAPARIKIVTKVEPNQAERVRLVAQAPSPEEQKQAQAASQKGMAIDAQPVGESHFANPTPMSVDKGASAMVSMMRKETEGEVVYLYDAESERGNAAFAFRAVRFKNPTDSTLETGPVTVYGNERFIGEGLTEPVPPKASAVVPYALDRQIVVERNDGEDNRLSRLVTLQRGVLTAEVQHIRRQKLVVTNRLREPAKVFIRHTVNKGWTLLEAPPAFERVGEAHLFQVDLKPGEVRTVEIAEATPMERTLDLNAEVTLDMMKVYVEAPEGSRELKDQLKKLLSIHKGLVDLSEEQVSLRRRLVDFKERMDELHAQIMTLQAVKTGGDLMAHLKTKMKDISERVQKTTIKIVDQEEKIMLARVQFQDSLAELTLPDALAGGKTSIAGPSTKK
jgi:OmpA family protein